MKQLFLTSATSFVSHDLVKHVDLSRGNKLAFIDTAAEAEEGDKQWLKDDRQSLVDASFNVTDYTITNKNKSGIEADLMGFQYICLSGGNTYYLLQQSIRSDFISYIHKVIMTGEKTYLGSSAGSIIAGPILPEYLVELDDPKDMGLEQGKAYNLVNFMVLPHWGFEGFKKRYLEGRLELLYRKDQHPFVLLTDNQYIHVQGEQMKIVDVENT